MAIKYKIRTTGLKKAQANLNEKTKEIEGKTKKGLITAGLHLENATEKYVPVDTGNLRASVYTVWDTAPIKSPTFKGKEAGKLSRQYKQEATEKRNTTKMTLGQILVKVGFAANYALKVHEAPPGTKFKRPGAKRKYLERALREETKWMADIIASEAKI